MKARSGYSGEWVIASTAALDNTAALTLQFPAEANAGYALYTYNVGTGTLKMLGATDSEVGQLASANTPASYTLTGLSLSSGDWVFVAGGSQVIGGKTDGATVNISGLSLTATTADGVPEPPLFACFGEG